jgi:hypothetical protein
VSDPATTSASHGASHQALALRLTLPLCRSGRVANPVRLRGDGERAYDPGPVPADRPLLTDCPRLDISRMLNGVRVPGGPDSTWRDSVWGGHEEPRVGHGPLR